MSLNQRERRATSEELHANLRRAALTTAEVAQALDRDPVRVQAALDVAEARPEDVWLVRDFLERAVQAAGATPTPYSVLTNRARAAASTWFPLADADDATEQAAR